jgi:hypothetical protein
MATHIGGTQRLYSHNAAGAVPQTAWFAAGAIIAFLVPFIFTTAIDTPLNLYYLVYFSITGAFLAAYVRATGVDLVAVFTRNWRWSLGLGVLAAAFLVFSVLNREDSTPHPSGFEFAFSIAWRGVIYGIVDALLLSGFPALIALALHNNDLAGLRRKLSFAGVALVLTLVITAVYHLGYEQFREDGVSAPEFGNTVISIPVLATANPLGSVIAHASMHVAADTRAYETEVFLPPKTTVE